MTKEQEIANLKAEITRLQTRLSELAEPLDAFSEHIDKTDTCWFWTGPLNNKYPCVNGEYIRPLAYAQAHQKQAPLGARVKTRCRERLCVHPAHMYIPSAVRANAGLFERAGIVLQPAKVSVRLTEARAHLKALGLAQDEDAPLEGE